MLGTNVTGLPRIGTEYSTAWRRVFKTLQRYAIKPPGKIIDGTKSRDPGNTPTSVLRAGLLMGKVTSGGKYAPAIFGVTTGALTSVGTSITLSAAQATELVRRVGTTGTFKLTAPPTAAGTVRSLTATYSAVNTTTGVVTITALGVDEVQTISVDTIVSGGSVNLQVVKSDGTVSNIEVAYNSSWTQTVADIQTALNAFLGTSAVACAVAATKNMTVTFSGTNYAALPQTLIVADFSAATGPTTVTVARTTTGVDGRMIAGAFVGDVDGSYLPVSIIPDGAGIRVTDIDLSTALDQPFPQFPEAGELESAQIIDWPSDTSLRAWIVSALNTSGQGFFSFDHLT